MWGSDVLFGNCLVWKGRTATWANQKGRHGWGENGVGNGIGADLK